jgi:hypothetical protein
MNELLDTALIAPKNDCTNRKVMESREYVNSLVGEVFRLPEVTSAVL